MQIYRGMKARGVGQTAETDERRGKLRGKQRGKSGANNGKGRAHSWKSGREHMLLREEGRNQAETLE